jgi:quinol monooxygenase YgiN
MKIRAATSPLFPLAFLVLVLTFLAGTNPPGAQAQQSGQKQERVRGDPRGSRHQRRTTCGCNQVLQEFAAKSQKDPGNVRFELLVQDGCLNHFTIVEIWQTREAFEAHSSAEHTKRFREEIQPVMGSLLMSGCMPADRSQRCPHSGECHFTAFRIVPDINIGCS